MNMCEIIEKIRKYCLEVHHEDGNLYTVIVNQKNVNKVVDMLKGVGAELHFNYSDNILIEVLL